MIVDTGQATDKRLMSFFVSAAFHINFRKWTTRQGGFKRSNRLVRDEMAEDGI
jgi:hypothetical protein